MKPGWVSAVVALSILEVQIDLYQSVSEANCKFGLIFQDNSAFIRKNQDLIRFREKINFGHQNTQVGVFCHIKYPNF